MLFSCIIYSVFGYVMYFLGTQGAHNYALIGKKTVFWTVSNVLIILFFSVISGLRYNVGVDYPTYYKIFTNLQNGFAPSESIEPLFVYISQLWVKLGAGHFMYFAFWAFLQVFFVYYGLKKHQYLYPFIGLLIFLGPHYLSWMNGIRQSIVACVFVWACHFIIDRKFIKYCIAIIICSFMHKSAIILLPLYFLPNVDYFKGKFTWIAVLIACAIIGQTGIVQNYMNFIGQYLSFIGYDNYSQSFDNIMENSVDRAFGPRRILMLIIEILIIWFSSDMKSYYKDKFLLFSYNMFIIYACLSELLSNTNFLFTRPLLYFLPFVLICSAFLLVYLKNRYGMLSRKPIFLFALLISCIYTFAAVAAVANDPNSSTLFKFIF